MIARCRVIFFLVIASCTMLTACENDLRDVEKISSRMAGESVEISKGVEIIYSDSARVKAKIMAPELKHFKTEMPYYEMKKGLTAIFYDTDQKETSHITADYGSWTESDESFELRDNVVVTNQEGKVFKSDELIWDATKRQFYSNKLVSIITPNQTIHGTKFWANDKFSYYEIQQSTGDFEY